MSEPPVSICLDQLIPPDKHTDGIPQLFANLSQCWPEDAFLRDGSFLDFVPDLEIDMRAFFHNFAIWQGEPVLEVNLYVDGSSFTNQNRQPSQAEEAAWALIVLLRVESNDRYCFFGATGSPLSTQTAGDIVGLNVGEFLNDPLSSEAVGMLWTMAWIAQRCFACHVNVFYDNMTIGAYAAGTQMWQPT